MPRPPRKLAYKKEVREKTPELIEEIRSDYADPKISLKALYAKHRVSQQFVEELIVSFGWKRRPSTTPGKKKFVHLQSTCKVDDVPRPPSLITELVLLASGFMREKENAKQ